MEQEWSWSLKNVTPLISGGNDVPIHFLMWERVPIPFCTENDT